MRTGGGAELGQWARALAVGGARTFAVRLSGLIAAGRSAIPAPPSSTVSVPSGPCRLSVTCTVGALHLDPGGLPQFGDVLIDIATGRFAALLHEVGETIGKGI